MLRQAKTTVSSYLRGRASRIEYALTLVCVIIAVVAARYIVRPALIQEATESGAATTAVLLLLIYGLITLCVLIASYAAIVRRCHDIGWAGWPWGLALIAFNVSGVVLDLPRVFYIWEIVFFIVLLFKRGKSLATEGENDGVNECPTQ